MAIFYQQDIDETTRLGIWKIEEDETFFDVPVQRSITHPHKRLQHLAGRYLLRYLFPDFPVDLIQIADTRKPYLPDEEYHFSISHCSDYAAAIASKDKRVGIDIETPNDKVDRIKHKFLHEEDLEAVSGSLTMNDICQQQTLPLTMLWSSKEAVFKWWSYGNVDFSEMIRIDECPFDKEGCLKGRFLSSDHVFPLDINYKVFDAICLAWLKSQ